MREENSHGVLLLHGFGDTPQTFGYLASDLHAAGFAVKAPLLPGHGRNPESFMASTSDDWLSCARSAVESMLTQHESVSVTGLSMGGALASIVAAERREVSSLVLIAPYLGMPRGLYLLARMHRLWGPLAGVIRSSRGRSIHDPQERAKNLGYGLVTGQLLNELATVVAKGRAALEKVTAPTFVLQSRQDSRLKPRVAEHVFATLGSRKKRLVWVADAGHILTVDHGRERVNAEVVSWIRSNQAQTSEG